MKRAKAFISMLLVLCLTVSFAGCSSNHDKGNLKDNLIDGWNSWMQSFSKHALTKEKDLQGEKEEGVDAYTGTYSAAYDGFNGKEFIFGGTALERENGNHLQVTYKLTIEDGTAELNWIAGNNEYSVAGDSSEDTKEYTISSGDNYIVLKGENFIGNLELTVKDVEN
ncbi:MAG: hypothetical protein K2N01_02695 [Lachnospiraceae bacterium]|nr:hypothetical protein [Lachnospiraceae bacterium]